MWSYNTKVSPANFTYGNKLDRRYMLAWTWFDDDELFSNLEAFGLPDDGPYIEDEVYAELADAARKLYADVEVRAELEKLDQIDRMVSETGTETARVMLDEIFKR